MTVAGPQFGVKYTLTGPDGTKAVFNDSTDTNFVGYLTEITGFDSPEVRENADVLAGLDGGVHGAFYYGRRPITLTGKIINVASTTDRNEKQAKLIGASNAMRKDATLTWTPSGGEEQELKLRRSQPVRITGGWDKEFQVQMTSADPRIYSTKLETKTGTITQATPLTVGTETSGVAATTDGSYVFVVSKGENKVYSYKRNATTGILTLVESKATGTGPTKVVVSSLVGATKWNVYVLNSTAATISKFEINQTNGKLTAVGTALATKEEPTDMVMSAGPARPKAPAGEAVLVACKKSKLIDIEMRTPSTGDLSPFESKGSSFTSPFALAAPNWKFETDYIFFAIDSGTKKLYAMKAITEEGGNQLDVETSTTLTETPEAIVASKGTAFEEGIVSVLTKKQLITFNYNAENKVLTQIGAVNPAGEGPYVVAHSSEFGTKDMVSYSIGETFYILSGENFKKGNAIAPPHFTPVEGKTIQAIGRGTSSEGIDSLYVTAGNAVATYGIDHKLARPYLGSGSSNECENKGNIESFPIVKIKIPSEGSIENPTLLNESTNEVFSIIGTLHSEETIILNMHNHTIEDIYGANLFAKVTPGSNWFSLQPGHNKITIVSETFVGSVELVVEWRNAWI